MTEFLESTISLNSSVCMNSRDKGMFLRYWWPSLKHGKLAWAWWNTVANADARVGASAKIMTCHVPNYVIDDIKTKMTICFGKTGYLSILQKWTFLLWSHYLHCLKIHWGIALFRWLNIMLFNRNLDDLF